MTSALAQLSDRVWDVIVMGGGNAGVCAAISAAERDCSVLVIEAAPADMRGGYTRHTRNLRAMHDAPTDVLFVGESESLNLREPFRNLRFSSLGILNIP